MVSYRETIPFDRDLAVTDGTRHLFADEHHCVRPECDCTVANLMLLEVDPAPGPDGVRRAKQVAGLSVDHRTGRWSEVDSGGPLGKEALRLRGLLLAAHPQLLATLARQHEVLRGLYRTAVAARGLVQTPLEPLSAAPRVGRNDPCPCGSGKKHKKCCLAS